MLKAEITDLDAAQWILGAPLQRMCGQEAEDGAVMTNDPACRMNVDAKYAAINGVHEEIGLCCCPAECGTKFDANPAQAKAVS